MKKEIGEITKKHLPNNRSAGMPAVLYADACLNESVGKVSV
jgi:hypothetical protein